MLAVWILAAASILLQAAQEEPTDPAQGRRLARLEEEVRRQEAEIEDLRRRDRFSITCSDGLRILSADGAFNLRLGARFIEGFRDVHDRPEGARTSSDTFYLRQAVLEFDATVQERFRLLVRPNLASSEAGPRPALATSYAEWRLAEEFALAFGMFRMPQGHEASLTTLFTDLAERSILSLFIPGHDLGIRARGEIAAGVIEYHLALGNGRSHLANEGRLRHDDNDEKEVLARLVVSPWAAAAESLLRRLRAGAYGSITDVDDVPMAAEFELVTTELAVTFLDPAGGVLDGRRTRLGADLSWAAGPVSLSGEILLREDEIAGSGIEEQLPIRAWYGSATWLVTGEEKVPGRLVSPAGPWGALELALRAAGASIGDEIERVGAPLAGRTDRVRTWTAGLNWYPDGNARFSANLVRENYEGEIDFGGGRRERALTGIVLRAQVSF